MGPDDSTIPRQNVKGVLRGSWVILGTVRCRVIAILPIFLGVVMWGSMASATDSLPYATRAETAMILLKSRLSGPVEAVSGNKRYPDIQAGSWYERYMVLAARYRILEPEAGTNLLRPNDVVFRSEFLTMLQRTFGLRSDLPHSYADVPAEAWFASVAGIASYYALFPGDRDNRRLSPDSLLTHSEIAQAIHILLRKIDTTSLAQLAEYTDPKPLPVKTVPQTLTIPKAAAPRISTTTARITLVQQSGPRLMPVASSASSNAGSELSTLPSLRNEVLVLINKERAKTGLRALKVHADLEQSAQRYAEQMLAQEFFSHTDPAGKTLRDRMEVSGYQKSFYDQTCFCTTRTTMGENIAQGQKTPAEVVRDWMASPSHKAAILTAGFTDTGIGIRSGIWVQHFGGMEKSVELSLP